MLSEKDLLILSHLRSDARKKLTEISREIDLPVSTIFDRLNVLEREIIEKHTSLINFKKLGFNFKTHIIINTKKNKEREVIEYLRNNYNVNHIYKTDNFGDFFIEAIFNDDSRLNDFIEELEKFDVNFSRIYNITDEIKKEGFLSLRER